MLINCYPERHISEQVKNIYAIFHSGAIHVKVLLVVNQTASSQIITISGV